MERRSRGSSGTWVSLRGAGTIRAPVIRPLGLRSVETLKRGFFRHSRLGYIALHGPRSPRAWPRRRGARGPRWLWPRTTPGTHGAALMGRRPGMQSPPSPDPASISTSHRVESRVYEPTGLKTYLATVVSPQASYHRCTALGLAPCKVYRLYRMYRLTGSCMQCHSRRRIFVCVQPYSTTLFGVPFPLPTPQGAGIGNSRTSPRPRFESCARQPSGQEAHSANLFRKECQRCNEARRLWTKALIVGRI
jgi:hypothetical protein